MDLDAATIDLKQRLLKEVARFYKRDHLLWKEPIVDTLRDLQKTNLRAVFFGGTLRSLLVARHFYKKPGRPRDVDIVVSGASIDALKEQFANFIARETRFGGLQLRRQDWQFDLWPLRQTWAFVRDAIEQPDFSALPSTTFFNLEAVAVEVWARAGCAREIFSGDEQFFKGILTRTLEINREENPFPELCVVRALVMGAALDFKIGPKLAAYITRHGPSMTAIELEEVQRRHYGQLRKDGETLRTWIELIAESHSRDQKSAFGIPMQRQRRFWFSELGEPSCFRIQALSR